MLDFFVVEEKKRSVKQGQIIEVYPSFKVKRSEDLMIRGGHFYAIWDSKSGLWSSDEYDCQRLVDEALWKRRDELSKEDPEAVVLVRTMQDYSSKSWIEFKNYISKMSDNCKTLDEKITFANTDVKKEDYVSKRLNYNLEDGKCPAYDELMRTLYDPEERQKLEWAIGSIIEGDARNIQKFIVLYGEPGSGKGTVLNIIQKLFDGYYTMFDAKALTSSANAFSTEVFRSNPLVGIQHDGDLSKIEDNTKLNSIVSHEEMTINEKFKSSYTTRINCFLFLGTNRPVKITDAKSGLIRRLIDVTPSNRTLKPMKYHQLMDSIQFELGAIAWHCREVYRSLGKNYYAGYKPLSMIFKTDVFFNFVEEMQDALTKDSGITLAHAYDLYKTYCENSLVEFKLAKYKFREELKNYFNTFQERAWVDGKQVRSWYSDFNLDKLESKKEEKEQIDIPDWLRMKSIKDGERSIVDIILAECQAQYANEEGLPVNRWVNVRTTLKDICTTRLHYVKPPSQHIVVDFDIRGPGGEKNLEANLIAASKFPPTYAELSKSGKGIHLHYIYTDDINELNSIYAESVEIKVFKGNSALRRQLTLCNNIDISTISSGLPRKEACKTINWEGVRNEKAIRSSIERALRKEIHQDTTSNINFIKHVLDDAYNSEVPYDVRDLRSKIFTFAGGSTNQAKRCLHVVSDMKFTSKEHELEHVQSEDNDDALVFFDVEVYPNLLLVCWKYQDDSNINDLVNPSPFDIEQLFSKKLIGFNNRKYDNHILWARYLGWTTEEIAKYSSSIINGNAERNMLFSEAYRVSYTDVYDFCSEKKSLKKYEIDLGITHKEINIPWTEPAPEELWPEIISYCHNDVQATEAVFKANRGDWVTREVLSKMSGLTVNESTNAHSQQIVFGSERHPQSEFRYRDLSKPVREPFGDEPCRLFNTNGEPVYKDYIPGEELLPGWSVKPFFPDYEFDGHTSVFRGRKVGEGGAVLAKHGIWHNVITEDVASMHPNSIIQEQLFGEKYTKRFENLVRTRLAIKHGDKKEIEKLLGEFLPQEEIQEYISDPTMLKHLTKAFKIVINAVYGQTAAGYSNRFRDDRNVDNIVAKRGALFIMSLYDKLVERGVEPIHVKTDSIKIANATRETLEFIEQYGKEFGYTFEIEAEYDRMCLVNDAVYIAKLNDAGDIQWTATGAQFSHPYVFKTLFSHDPLIFADMCETKSVTTAMYIDMNEGLDPDEHRLIFIGKVGQFCPMKPGTGGGVLLRENNDRGKYSSITGTKGYRWLESENVKLLDKMDDIDTGYFDKLCEDAVKAIEKFGDFNSFVQDDEDVCLPF